MTARNGATLGDNQKEEKERKKKKKLGRDKKFLIKWPRVNFEKGVFPVVWQEIGKW